MWVAAVLDVVDVVGGEAAVLGCEGVWFACPANAPFAVLCSVAVYGGFASSAVGGFVDLRWCCLLVVLVAFGLMCGASAAGLDVGAAWLGAHLQSLAGHSFGWLMGSSLSACAVLRTRA